jgi:uncharacterized membrane protein
VSPSRLHGLIDGIFAIAITLLVLDLPKPEDSHHLSHDLLAHWPGYAAYLVTFITIGVIWIEHHGMMSAVRFTNRRFMELTLAFLLFVSLMPWPTALAAEYIDKNSQATAAAVLYAGVMLGLGWSFAASWRYLERHPQLVAEVARDAVRGAGRRAFLGGTAYVAAIVLAFISPTASFVVDALIAAYYAASRSEVPGLIHRAALAGDE